MPTTFKLESEDYKRQVARRFDRAAPSYDTYAKFQQQVLQQLLQKLPHEALTRMMDLGAGTGQALASLCSHSPAAQCVAVDLSSSMLGTAREQCSYKSAEFVCADAEALPFAGGSFDLVFSSLALQWCLSPAILFAELSRVLDKDGWLMFATLTQGSMPEVTEAWQGLDDNDHIHHYMSFEKLIEAVESETGLAVVSKQLSKITMWFDSPQSAIHSLTKVGASLIAADQSAISPTKWKAFLAQYEQQRVTSGVPLSYQVAFVVARKKETALGN